MLLWWIVPLPLHFAHFAKLDEHFLQASLAMDTTSSATDRRLPKLGVRPEYVAGCSRRQLDYA